jgi:hypothetical protein
MAPSRHPSLLRHARPGRRAGLAVGVFTLAAAGASACGNGDPGGTADAAPPSVSPTPPATSAASEAHASGLAKSFRTRPDLHPSQIIVTKHAHGVAPGYIFAAPRPVSPARGGPMMFDDRGRLIWFKQLAAGIQAVDFKVQHYEGNPVLTWGQRPVSTREGAYEVIANRHYRTIGRVKMTGAGVTTDLHDFKLLPNGNALMLGFRMVHRDLRRWGGSANGTVEEGVVQVVNVKSGKPVFTWHSLSHIGIGESYRRPDGSGAFDYLHANSVDITNDGNILMSARHTSAVYKISRKTGRILWRLNGKRSSFKVSRKAKFAFQHDAVPLPNGDVTVFDNAAIDHGSRKRSAGMRIHVDTRHHRATLVRAYRRPGKLGLLSTSQGNYQVLPNGDAFVGWGSRPDLSEFSPRGKLLFDAHFPSTSQQSYRAFRFPWSGRPLGSPTIKAGRRAAKTTVAASWNGATDVDRWVVLAGKRPSALKPVGVGPWKGFETILTVRTREPYVAVRALDARGKALRTSNAVRP